LGRRAIRRIRGFLPPSSASPRELTATRANVSHVTTQRAAEAYCNIALGYVRDVIGGWPAIVGTED
jgi:hypothetical protein